MRKEKEVQKWIERLLEAKPGIAASRLEAAERLAAAWLDVEAFNALYSLCVFPDVYALEEGIVPVVGHWMGKILSLRDLAQDPLEHHALDPKRFQEVHPEALIAALEELTAMQLTLLAQYTLKNPFASESLQLYFYLDAYQNAIVLEGAHREEAIREAKKGMQFFHRLRQKIFEDFICNIVFLIIAQRRWEEIYSAFLELLRNYELMEPPRTIIETYTRYHFMFLTKMVCRDFSGLQSLFEQLSDWTCSHRPEDKCYVEIFGLILNRQHEEALHLMGTVKGKLIAKGKLAETDLFYFSWCLIASWYLKQVRS